MSSPIDSGLKNEQELNETERAKAAFAKKLSNELQDFFIDGSGKIADKGMADFIANNVTERLTDRFKDVPPEKLAEVFESALSFEDVSVVRNQQENSVNMTLKKQTGLDDDHEAIILEELNRAQLLAIAADKGFKGNVDIAKFNVAGAVQGRLEESDLMMIHRRLYDKKSSIDHSFGRGDRLLADCSLAYDLPAGEIYDRDPSLFADMMIASAVSNGADNGTNFNDAWKKMQKDNFAPAGTAVSYTEEGIPYRPGKRKEDVEMIKKQLELYGQGEPKVETFEDSTRKNQELKSANEVLTSQNEELKEENSALARENEELKSKAVAAEQLAKIMTPEKSPELTAAEERASQLEAQLAQVLAILNQKGSMFGDKRIQDAIRTASVN